MFHGCKFDFHASLLKGITFLYSMNMDAFFVSGTFIVCSGGNIIRGKFNPSVVQFW